MKKNIKLIALDMDGTLLNNQGQISKENQIAIRKATDSGIHVVISTGRAYIGLPVELLCSLGIHYAITSNAAAIYRLPEKECIYSSCMPPEIVCPIIPRLKDKEIHFDAFIQGKRYCEKRMLPIIDKLSQMPSATREYVKNTGNYVENLSDFILENNLQVEKITIYFYPLSDGSYKDRDAVSSILSEFPAITFQTGGYANLEFTKAETTKSKGLRFLAEKFNISLEETMACGDSQNDLDIITAAGIGVAMGNASSDVKAAADFITLSNEENGVAHAIYQAVKRLF